MIANLHHRATLIHCRCGADQLLIRTPDVANIFQARRMEPVASNEQGLVGSVPWRGVSTPVIDLSVRLHNDGRPVSNHGYILVVDTPTGGVGLRVDGLSRAMESEHTVVTPMPRLASRLAPPWFTDVQCQPVANITRMTAFETDEDRAEDTLTLAAVQNLALVLAPHNMLQTEWIIRSDPWSDVAVGTVPSAQVVERVAPRSTPTRAQDHGRLLLFMTNDQLIDGTAHWIGLSVTQVEEIVQTCELITVPSAHPLLLGLTPWRQLPIPVIDLARLLGLANAPSTVRRRLVIARDGVSGERFGFFASDEIRSLRGSLPLTASAPSPRLTEQFVRATFAIEDETIVAPDLRAIFA